MATAFKTNPVGLEDLLRQCQSGDLQLPDFQRSWVWDDERIRGLIASISQAFPVGALMTLETGGEVDFKPRPVQGAPEQAFKRKPVALLLDGQQRMTSLYQTTLRNQVVETVTPRQVKVKRWYYIDIRKAARSQRGEAGRHHRRARGSARARQLQGRSGRLVD